MVREYNPFQVSGYRGASYFCNREEETALLRQNIKNNINTTLFSIRRLGKTGLIYHLFDSYKNNPKTACIYVDILGTTDLKDFCGHLATAIYKRFPENKSVGKRILDFFRLLKPVITFDDLSGQPELSFESSEGKKIEKTIQQLFGFLDQQKMNVVFAIDEFQQILNYPEKNTEALLRTYIQQLKHTRFIFCGSNQKMMHELFNSVKRPFFGSCSNMNLGYIEEKKYAAFIIKLFKKGKKNIDAESVSFIYEWTMGHTYYIQYFCNQLFALKTKTVKMNDVRNVAIEILNQNENSFYQYRNLLTKAQWNLLSAIAKESRLYKAHSIDFIRKYNLGSSSMVSRGIEALLEKELIFHYATAEKPYYEVYDKFLLQWMQHN